MNFLTSVLSSPNVATRKPFELPCHYRDMTPFEKLETDDDPARFDERMKKLVKHKPVEKPE